MASNTVHIDPSNEGQLRAWDGDEGSYWAANADRYDRSVQVHHRRLLAAAAIGTADRVLDIGCGTGQLSRDAARAASSGSALGVDLSSAMIDVARARAAQEGLTNVTFEQRDAQIHSFSAAAFDLVAQQNWRHVLRRPGRRLREPRPRRSARRTDGPAHLAALSQNEWMRELMTALAAGRDLPAPPPDAPGPFSLSDPERVRTILSGAGFTDIELAETRGAMSFGTDADDAQAFVLGQLGWLLEGLDPAGRTRRLDALHTSASSHETDQGVFYDSAAWIITATHN